MSEIAETLIDRALPEKLSRRKTAQKRRTEHEKTYKSVQNPCSLFSVSSPEIAPDLASSIRPVSTVAVRVIGNDEVSGSIPLPGTTCQRGALSEMEVMMRLARLGASVWTPAFGHDHSFDLIAHWGGNLCRVQVKTMRDVDENAISLSGTRVVDRAGGKQYPAITAADCDVIIGFHPGLEMAYVVPPSGKTRYTLRKNAPKNNQLIGVWFEADFRLMHLDQLLPARP